MKRTAIGSVLLTVFVVIGMTAPAVALSTSTSLSSGSGFSGTTAAMTAQETATQNSSSMNVTVGQQLSTVIGVSSDEVQTDFENTAFEISVENASEEEQAKAIADRADELRDHAKAIREDHEEATEAYEEREISKSGYAQRLATLNARAANLLDSYERLQQRAANVSVLELRAAAVNRSALKEAVENVSDVSGAGPAALLEQFTGESRGEIELEATSGLSIEVRNEDGERSREIERSRDRDDNFTISQSAAFETARAALSNQPNATWVLRKASVHDDSGYYKFEFTLDGATEPGEAEVRVDGSSGDVFRLEEEIEPREEDDREDREIERPRDDDPAITVNQSAALATARAALSDQPNATWALEEASVHNDSGYYKFEFTLDGATESGEAEVRVDGSSGDVFRLKEEIEPPEDQGEGDREDRELAMIVAEGTPESNATVTLQVLADGAPAENVTVYLNDQAVGTTDANGAVTVTLPASGEAKLTAQRGDAEGELEFEFEEDDEDDEVFQKLNADATLDGGTVTVVVSYNGSSIENASVYANGQRIGATNSDGTVTFTIDSNATEDLELEVVKGAFEAELTYVIQDGTLTLTEEAHEGDDDKAEEDEQEDEKDDEETESDDEDEEEGDEEETETEEEEDDQETETESASDDEDEEEGDKEETETEEEEDDQETETDEEA